MKYTFWNNKGGTGKTSLCFQTIAEYAISNPTQKILCVDLCPQANLTELMLGGLLNNGSSRLTELWDEPIRRSIGGYFQVRLSTPYNIPAININNYIAKVNDYNINIPENLDIIAGDRIIELQANSISALSITQIPGVDTYVKVVSWLRDLFDSIESENEYDVIFIDTNPSFAIYTQIAITATERLIVPVMADDSSRRALSNVFSLIYGINLPSSIYNDYAYNTKITSGGLELPKIHLVVKNRLTQYMGPASAYYSVLTSIDEDIQNIIDHYPEIFTFDSLADGISNVRDFQTTGVVSFAKAVPFTKLSVGRHNIFGTETQVRQDYLNNCIIAMESITEKL
ncbi:ParA family protein [Epilithonimonas mollis]|uniref:AAA domain-containing protein n=1 Tax=Epilithonimonas mollis TaxID=216903 RepID=A0A1M6U3B2_9FLAO|nr:ParA family protein [Epilithonimonas mollis]SHK63772.1 AAA domain-containing protein [Epilithonimonas mollis]